MVFGTGCSDSEVSGTDVSKGSGPNPVATITMKSGKVIKVELYPDVAPNTVNNFISLANSGFYDGTIFHRVIEGFMIARRRSSRDRNRRTWLQHKGRVQFQWF